MTVIRLEIALFLSFLFKNKLKLVVAPRYSYCYYTLVIKIVRYITEKEIHIITHGINISIRK